MTKLGNDIINATLGNAQTLLLVPASCRPTLTLTRADGSTEVRELGDVALVPVIDMPAAIDDLTEIKEDNHARE
jgi:hypothetical protein